MKIRVHPILQMAWFIIALCGIVGKYTSDPFDHWPGSWIVEISGDIGSYLFYALGIAWCCGKIRMLNAGIYTAIIAGAAMATRLIMIVVVYKPF